MTAAAVGSGIPTWKREAIGASVAGRIVAAEDVQQTEYQGTRLAWWGENGKPVLLSKAEAEARGLKEVWQVKVTLETQPQNPVNTGDENETRINVFFSSKQNLKAAKDAFLAAGRRDFTVGDDMRVTFVAITQPGNGKSIDVIYNAVN